MTGTGACDVAVVGYGPVGALAALLLARAGLRCTVLDRRAEVHDLPRAVAADDEVLRLLVASGLGDTVAGMLAVPGATFLGHHGRVVLDVDLPGQGSGQPGLALFRQPDVEAALRARVGAEPRVRTRLGRAVTALAQDATGVTLTLDDGEEVRARFVLGCDGARSTVRGLLGVGTRGPAAAQRWLVVDLRTREPTPTPARVTYHCVPGRAVVHMPTPGGRRLEFLLPAGEPVPAPEALVAPHLDGVPAVVERAADYEYRVRRACRWRVGRVLLAGDAAHTMPPFAGQGLAAGFRDAADLAWRLPLVVRGLAGDGLLDGYERERRPHVARMTTLSRIAGAVLTTPSPRAAVLRDTALATLTRVPGLGGWLRSGGPRPRQALRPAVRLPARLAAAVAVGGRRSALRPLGLPPDARVAGPGGGAVTRLDLEVAHRFALLGLGVDPLDALAPAERAVWEAVGARAVAVAPPGVPAPPGLPAPPGVPEPGRDADVLTDVDGTLLALGTGRVVVLRPDRQVVAVVPAARLPAVTRRLARGLG